MLDRTAVIVRAMVAAVSKKLFEQIAVGAVNLNAVEASLLGELRATAELFDYVGDLLSFQGAGNRVRLCASRGGGYAASGKSRGGDRQAAVRLQKWVRLATHMPELEEYAAANIMNSLRNQTTAKACLGRTEKKACSWPAKRRSCAKGPAARSCSGLGSKHHQAGTHGDTDRHHS